MEALNEKKKEFRFILLDEGIKAAIQAMTAYLYEDSPKYRIILAIEGRRKELLDTRMKGTLKTEDFQTEQNKLRDDILSLIDEITESDTLPASSISQGKSSQKRPLYTHTYFLVGSGTLLLILIVLITKMTTSTLRDQPYMFDIEESRLAFRSDDTITLKEPSAHQLDRIYVQIGKKGDYFMKDDQCDCWHIDLKRYYLREGVFEIKIGPNPRTFQDPEKHTFNEIEIDNTIAEGLWEAQSMTIEDSLLVEVKGLSNEKVNLDITLPFAPDSVKTSFQIVEDPDGFYFFQQVKIPRDLAAKYKNTSIPIFISDDAGNQIGSAITLDMLEKGNVPPMFFGNHYKYFAEGKGFIDLGDAPLDAWPDAPQEAPSNTKNEQEDSLVLRIAMFSPKMIGLSWQLKNAGSREIEYSLHKRIAKGIMKDTASKFVPVDYFSATSFNDMEVQTGYVYEYYVEARDKSSDQVITSNYVQQGIPPALQQMAQKLKDFAMIDSLRPEYPKIPSRLPTSNIMNETLKSRQGVASNAIERKVFAEMILIEGGTFMMGSKDGLSREQPAHSVTLTTFFMGKHEVTQELWKEVMGNNPSHFNDCDKCPVENVSWNEIQTFLQKLNQLTGQQYRLPTEAEWEYAAKGGVNSRDFEYAGSKELDKVGWYSNNSGRKTHPVGQKQPNEVGLYDMSGNVWEWCQDWYGTYPSEAQTDPQGPKSGDSRVVRGGSWNYDASNCRVADRDDVHPSVRDDVVGFRLARTVNF